MLDALRAIQRNNLLKKKPECVKAKEAAQIRENIKPDTGLKAKIIELSANHTAKEVAAILGISDSTVYKYCNGYSPKGKVSFRANPDNIKEVRRLIKLHSQAEVAELMGVSPTTIWHMVKDS